jgi:pilus assembly protein CpaB
MEFVYPPLVINSNDRTRLKEIERTMDSNQTRTLWISIGAALLTIFLLYSWMQEQRSQAAAENGARERVVIALKDINEMESLDESKLEVVDLPTKFIQPDAVREPEAAHGQVAAAPIKKGEQILQTKLLTPGPDTGLSMEVSPGKRAITIPIDDMRGVSKLLRPGDRIDLVAALDYGKGADSKREVKAILQDVVVLATGLNVVNKIPRRVEMDPATKQINILNLSSSTNFGNITVEAKPEDIQVLVYILATSPGNLFAVLRHPNDRIIQPARVTSVDDVLQKAPLRLPASPPQVVAAPPPPVKVIPKKRNGNFQEL